MKQNNNSWILTYTGKKFYPLAPRIEDIDLLDIAHALSNICRFTGHTRKFYSVAQHSVFVAEWIWKETQNAEKALGGLFHDASEAYLCDIARPVKYSPEFVTYRVVESRLQAKIFEFFRITPDAELIRRADEHLLHIEAFALMPKCAEFPLTTAPPEGYKTFDCWSPIEAKLKFLQAASEIAEAFLRSKFYE